MALLAQQLRKAVPSEARERVAVEIHDKVLKPGLSSSTVMGRGRKLISKSVHVFQFPGSSRRPSRSSRA
jgi:hypothetical protein